MPIKIKIVQGNQRMISNNDFILSEFILLSILIIKSLNIQKNDVLF